MQSNKYSILCVDSYPDTLELLKIIFEDKDFIATVCDSMEDCLPLIYENNYDAIILDNLVGGALSLDVSKKIREFDEHIPIIFYSAEVRTTEIERAMNTGANAYLIKPENFDNLINTVTELIRKNKHRYPDLS